jgi:hypothetical protein
MHRAFQTAITYFQPDVVFFLGDLFDEGKWCPPEEFEAGLWIRIDSVQIRIQHFSSIRIRIHKIFESGSYADPDPQWKI